MLNEREQLERDVLTMVRENVQPIGCGALSQMLQAQGYNISEATVGRVLRELDNLGFTEKAGFQGRVLSAQGIVRLDELESKRRRREWGEEFANALSGHTKDQLLEVLVARRAIEAELACLAAANRTDEEVKQLSELLAKQGGSAAEEDVEFHALIAHMARNRVLGAAIALIRQDTQLSPVLEYIRRHVKSMVYVDHRNLAQAIINSQPETAREVMTEHINNLISDVEKYWQLTTGDHYTG